MEAENGIKYGSYIYMERNGIHIINLYKRQQKIETNEALKKSLHQVKILFISYKSKQRDIVAEKAKAQTCLTLLKDGLVE
jgi:ribosomal protein S2